MTITRLSGFHSQMLGVKVDFLYGATDHKLFREVMLQGQVINKLRKFPKWMTTRKLKFLMILTLTNKFQHAEIEFITFQYFLSIKFLVWKKLSLAGQKFSL